MAIFDLPRQMAALDAVRDELETALGGDENWRALRRTGAPSGGDAEPDRRDRDARLMKALEANPLYLAWTNVRQAIDALRDAGPASSLDAAQDGRTEASAQDGKGTLGGKLAGIPSLDSVEAPGNTSAKPLVAASSEQAKSPRVEADADLSLPRFEPAEAKVTFVRRNAPTPAKAPAGVETEAKAAPAGDSFVPLTAADEAEVTIVKAPVRRFLKALSGD